jgi:trans-aconitate 2-methyltransferase
MVWNPGLYLKFHSARVRPAVDLLQKSVEMMGDSTSLVKKILDLGCGPGNVTPYLCEMFPNATVHGIDSSETMIEKARKATSKANYHNRATFEIDTIESALAKPLTEKYDFIYSNAALHWCVNHETLFPGIIQQLLKPTNGVFAMQMPDTRTQKSHLLMETAGLRSGLFEKIRGIRIPRTEQNPNWYYNIVAPFCKDVDLWSTEYIQQLPSYTQPTHTSLSEIDHTYHVSNQRHPVSDFTRATGLQPILKALGGENSELAKKYLDEYDRLLSDEYPSVTIKNKYHSNGKPVTLFPFKRFFLVCKT